MKNQSSKDMFVSLNPKAIKPLISVIGSINIDYITRTPHVPHAGETIHSTSFEVGFGGKGANQALATRRLSAWPVHVKMVGAIGSDENGQALVSSLEKNGVDVSTVRRPESDDQNGVDDNGDGKAATPHPLQTGSATILVEEKTGENRIMFVHGANYNVWGTQKGLNAKDASFKGYGHVTVLQLEVPLDTVTAHLTAAHDADVITVFNPSPVPESVPRSLFAKITVLICNETEIENLAKMTDDVFTDAYWGDCQPGEDRYCWNFEKRAKRFLNRGVEIVVLTLGSKGVYVVNKIFGEGEDMAVHTTFLKVPGGLVPADKVLDTTGAGDTFVGGLVACLAKAKAVASEQGDHISVKQQNKIVLEHETVCKFVEYAMVAARKSVQTKGAHNSIPMVEDLLDDKDYSLLAPVHGILGMFQCKKIEQG